MEERTFEYWNPDKNLELERFIGQQAHRQCPVCLLWPDQVRSEKKEFMKCSVCLKQGYCSKECQKKHWKQHKLECKKPNNSN